MLALICLFDNLNKMEEVDGKVRKDIVLGVRTRCARLGKGSWQQKQTCEAGHVGGKSPTTACDPENPWVEPEEERE